jgi:hypothetical protein
MLRQETGGDGEPEESGQSERREESDGCDGTAGEAERATSAEGLRSAPECDHRSARINEAVGPRGGGGGARGEMRLAGGSDSECSDNERSGG